VNATRNAAAYIGIYGMGRSLVSAAAMGGGPFGDGDPISSVLSDGERRKEIDALLDECRNRTRTLLLNKRSVVEGVRDALLEREELIGDEIEELMVRLGEGGPVEVGFGGRGGGAALPGGDGDGWGAGGGNGHGGNGNPPGWAPPPPPTSSEPLE
jgi:hypothetical protein